MIGLVGHTHSGKTHAMKALTYLLDRQGFGGKDAQKLAFEEQIPINTFAKVNDYCLVGPGDERLDFVDAGGEVYKLLHDNDWNNQILLKLIARLQACEGLVCFLHLDPGHFSREDLDNPNLARDSAERKQAKSRQEELSFFRDFLLFLRALRSESGDPTNLIQRCRNSNSLEQALAPYQTSARLDIPLMFFFTKADTYLDKGFEVRPGEQLAPREMDQSMAAFVAQRLPGLFSDIARQVDRFKFDFLQSYEEVHGAPQWEDEYDRSSLSVGLLSGLEFLLRNQTQGLPRWSWPGLTTLQALKLHRWLHPHQWRGVRLDLSKLEPGKPAPTTEETSS